MKILAIESSCDETAAAVVEDGRKVLSSVIASQVSEHIIYGGVVPEIASRMHAQAISGVVSKAMSDAGLDYSDLDAIAVTYAPGLIGALLVGVNFAKGLSYSTGLPLVPVHHLRSHIAANYITTPDLEPPFLCLVVSGGHSHIVAVNDYTDFSIIGRTRDDAAGECMDKAARAMGLPYPGGVNLDKISVNGDSSVYKLPHPHVEGSEYDFSFSGLKTAVVNIAHNASQKGEEIVKEDLCASLQTTIASILTQRTMLAANNLGYDTIAVAGGVSANSGIRSSFESACKAQNKRLYVPPLNLCGDNAAMIACQGYFEYLNGKRADLSLNAYATMPLEDN